MSASDAFESLLTYGQTAEVLGVSDRTVRTLVSTRALPAVRFGGNVRIDPVDLRRFIENRKSRATVPGSGSSTATNPANPPPNPA